jgi:hypothetical protein
MENGEYKRLIESAISEIKEEVIKNRDSIYKLSNDVAGIKVKASVFAGVGLALVAVSYAIISLLSQ